MTDHIFTPGNYTTRDGRKARILFRLSEPHNDTEPLIGEVMDHGVWEACWWDDYGRAGVGGEEYDLVPPVSYVWAAVTDRGAYGWNSKIDDALFYYCTGSTLLGILRAEGDGGPRRDRPILWLTLEQAQKLGQA